MGFLKSKTLAYSLLIVAVVIGFYTWQGKREVTKQLEEKTKQLEYIMEHPVEKIIEGPTRIVRGKEIIKTIVKEVMVDGTEKVTEIEKITEPTIVEKEGSVKETDYKDPIAEGKKKKRYSIFAQYFMDKTSGIGFTSEFLGVMVGPNVLYNIENKDIKFGAILMFQF